MLTAITLILAQATAPAGITYLDCSFARPGEPTKQMTVTLNESAGTVDYTTATAGAQRRTARFTAETVHFIGFTLSRVDLSLRRQTEFMGQLQAPETGRCTLKPTQARAF